MSLFGKDLDDLFKLATPKYVYIRDRNLGLLKYFFMLVIFGYVVVYEVLYTCSHLKPHPARGYGSITMRAPVSNCGGDRSCENNFKSVLALKYCKESHPEVEKGMEDTNAAKTNLLRQLKEKDQDAKDAKVKDTEEDGKKDKDTEEVKDTEGDKDAKDAEVKDTAKATTAAPTTAATKGGSDAKTSSGAQVGDFITKPGECRYLDDDRLTLAEEANTIFIPTKYVSYKQKMDSDCYDPLIKHLGGHTTRKAKAYECKKAWHTTHSEEFYVADIGDFTLQLTHSFMAPDIGKAGTSADYQGLFAACPNNHPKDARTACKLMEVPNTTGAIAPEDKTNLVDPKDFGVTSLVGTPDGLDQITLADLLALTPVAQKHGWKDDVLDRKSDGTSGHPDTSLREEGGMMMLSVNYANTGYMRPGIPGIDFPALSLGAVKPITYTYRPYFIPKKSNKRVEVKQSSDTSQERIVNVWYGVTVQMSFEGAIVEFSFSQLLHGLTTGLVLLSSATTIVIYIALYLHPRKEKYLLQMYQYTEDMSWYKDLKAKRAKQHMDTVPALHYTGKTLLSARKPRRKLEDNEILDILTDYEVRLNRCDGMDPELAFYEPPSESSVKDGSVAQAVRELHDEREKMREEFFNKAQKECSQGLE